ncbi:helix-turn-helix domain-containing protein [Solwaraspora sp. WMMD406]|uniref:helix-turn-helix domain-containing protein n=1 Tax=Solwaraspora sp. WMMD406 TaxID=3016095 RepID=UPI002416FED1|nr:helix-turn-helix domain-containing protein [Solwaraspora sp. WMMD406]MDG4763735.1 helix-turn-helix domain-containing protein [Solwaraspora sp. WMMD406]
MTDGRLAALLGATLRQERESRLLTQRALASRAGVGQASLARIERGVQTPSLALVERLFAAMDRQLTIGVEDLDAHVDRLLAGAGTRPFADRLGDTDVARFRQRATGISYVFDGPTAALLHGVPVPAPGVHVVLLWSEAAAVTDWLTRMYARRWYDKWQEYGHLPVDPREPGAHRWRTMAGEIHARMSDEVPERIEIRHDGETYPVVPLTEVEIADPHTADLLRRYRQLRGARGDGHPATD